MIIVARFQSESNCERLISKQKHTTGDYGTNYGCKTMQARLGLQEIMVQTMDAKQCKPDSGLKQPEI